MGTSDDAIERLADALTPRVDLVAVRVDGAWTRSTRRTYARPDQAGSGEGPFVDVEDAVFRGACTAATPIAAIAFLVRSDAIHWVKSAPAALALPLEIALRAAPALDATRATFGASLHRGHLPAPPVACGADPVAACVLGSTETTTGRAHVLATIDDARIIAIFLPGSALRVGRNRLFSLRPELTDALPEDLRALVRGRSGAITVE